jgi:hypothetical protein
MSETILRIGLDELKTIRLKIGANTTEMALKEESAMILFANEQKVTGKISPEAADILIALARYMLMAGQAWSTSPWAMAGVIRPRERCFRQ